MGLPAQRPRRLVAEDGFALMEVMAAAVLLLVISVATLNVFDVSNKISGASKARSIAANLAQQDIDRMRALKATDLSNYHESRDVDVSSGGTASVASRAEWVRDAGGVESCTVSTSQADYIRLTSTVTMNQLNDPVTTSTLIAPPIASFDANTGTLTVKITSRANAAVAGADVALSGPTSLSDTTNSLGCAVFSHIPVGTYSISTHKAGYVDKTGADPGTASGIVNAGKAAVVGTNLDQAATTTVSFQTYANSWATGSPGWITSSAKAASADPQTSTGEPNDVVIGSGFQGSITMNSLYPFAEGDTFFSGSCASGEPSASISNYWTATPANPGIVKPLDPAGTYTVNARQPPLPVKVTSALGAVQSGVTVVATPVGCAADKMVLTTNAQGLTSHTSGTYDPGVPFGTYTVCVSQPFGGGYLLKQQTVDAKSFTPSLTTMSLPTGISASPCS
jgi:Tfp pilus assembly protein PilV